MKWCFEGSALQDHFLTCYSPDHNNISMANANIDALYAGSLKINIAYVFPSYYILLVVRN